MSFWEIWSIFEMESLLRGTSLVIMSVIEYLVFVIENEICVPVGKDN